MSNEDPCLHFEAKLVPDLRTKIKKRVIATICDLKQPWRRSCGHDVIENFKMFRSDLWQLFEDFADLLRTCWGPFEDLRTLWVPGDLLRTWWPFDDIWGLFDDIGGPLEDIWGLSVDIWGPFKDFLRTLLVPLWGPFEYLRTSWWHLMTFWWHLMTFWGHVRTFWGHVRTFWGHVRTFSRPLRMYWATLRTYWGSEDLWGPFEDFWWPFEDVLRTFLVLLWGTDDHTEDILMVFWCPFEYLGIFWGPEDLIFIVYMDGVGWRFGWRVTFCMTLDDVWDDVG